MSGNGALVIAVLIGLPIGLALVGSRSKAFSISGLFVRDKRGRMTLVLSPAAKPKKKRRRRR